MAATLRLWLTEAPVCKGLVVLDHPTHLQGRLLKAALPPRKVSALGVYIYSINTYSLKPRVNARWAFGFLNSCNALLFPPLYKRPCHGNHYSKCPKPVPPGEHLIYHFALIFFGYIFFTFIFLISFVWIANPLKREIMYHILMPRMFRSKKSAWQRALPSRKKKKWLSTQSVPGIVGVLYIYSRRWD